MQSRRVTQRDVARAAGVSRPTVSLALRNHPGIPPATRERIRRAVDELGYKPDPALSALAVYRWSASSVHRSPMSIALVECCPDPDRDLASFYPHEVQRGALARARALGFSVSSFSFSSYQGNMRHLLRVMRARNIRGIVLLPSNRPLRLDADAGWEPFSIVAATTMVLTPRFHQVVVNQAYNMTALLGAMHQAGYRRIGAIFTQSYEERTLHAYSMALSWFGHRERILIVPDTGSEAEKQRLIRNWLVRQRPDLVFAQDIEGVSQLLPRSQRDVHVARIGEYIEQFGALNGEAAVRVLSGLLYNNECGIPAHPQITTIDGAVRRELIPPPRAPANRSARRR